MDSFHRKSYVCICVFRNEKPVLYVSRAEGDWMFLCGDRHEDVSANFRVVGMGHVTQRDPSLHTLLDLPAEWEAERQTIDGDWVRTPVKPDANEEG
jgi:hypothetical protein